MRAVGRAEDLCPLGNGRHVSLEKRSPVGTESLHRTVGGCHEARGHRFFFLRPQGLELGPGRGTSRKTSAHGKEQRDGMGVLGM